MKVGSSNSSGMWVGLLLLRLVSSSKNSYPSHAVSDPIRSSHPDQASLHHLRGEHDRRDEEARTSYGGTCGGPIFDAIPFDAGALDCTAFQDMSASRFGSCGKPIQGPLDSQPNSDSVCAARGGSCHVAFTEAGEWLEYTFQLPRPNRVYDIVARVASASGHPRDFQLVVDNGGDYITSPTLQSPGAGFFDFEDVVWEAAPMPLEGYERIFVEFLEEKTNYCSLSVRESAVDTRLTIPFDTDAQSFIDYYEKTEDSYGNCENKVRYTPVDAQETFDAVCHARGHTGCNIGWTDSGESLTYAVYNDQSSSVREQVILRLASRSDARFLEASLLETGESFQIGGPGDGWQSFRDISGELTFPPGQSHLMVKFLTGGVNFCALSVGVDPVEPFFTFSTPLSKPDEGFDIDKFGGQVKLDPTGSVLATMSTTHVWIYQGDWNGAPSWTLFGSHPVLELPYPVTNCAEACGRLQVLGVLQLGDRTILSVASKFQQGSFDDYIGYAYVYERADASSPWEPLGDPFLDILADSLGAVGAILTLDGDGKILLAITTTSSTDGSVNDFGYTALYRFDEVDEQWILVGETIPGFNAQTYSKVVAVVDGGNVVAVGNPSEIGTGEVQVYLHDDANPDPFWQPMGGPLTGDNYEDLFGDSIDLVKYDDSTYRLAVGVPGIIQCFSDCEHARVFEFTTGSDEWVPLGQILEPSEGMNGERYGHVVRFADGGDKLVVGQLSYDSEDDYGYHVWTWNNGASEWDLVVDHRGELDIDISPRYLSLDMGPVANDSNDGVVLVVGVPDDNLQQDVTVLQN